MFCKNCGAEVSENSKFCAECGQPTGAAQEAQPAASAVPEPPAPQADAPQASQPAAGAVPEPPAPQAEAPQASQPAAGQPQKPDEPWYGKTWVIILFLIFIWPVGLVLMWLKTCHWQKVAKIIISVVCGLMLVLQIGSIVSCASNMGSSTPSKSAASVSSTSSATTSKSSSSSKSSASSSASSKASGSSSKYLINGHPNGVAVLNLSGSELAKLCEDNGMKWSTKNNFFFGGENEKGWTSFYSYKILRELQNVNLTESEFKKAEAIGASNKAMMARFGSEEVGLLNAMNKEFTGVEAEAGGVNQDETEGLFLMKDDKGNDVLVHAMLDDEGQTIISIYNNTYCWSGVLSDSVDGGKTGKGASEVFNYFATEGAGKSWRIAG